MKTPSVDPERIRELVDLMDASGIAELEVRSGDDSVRIVRAPRTGAVSAPPNAPPALASGSATGHPVRAPMAGTFYAGSEPGAEPFVSEGRSVAAGDVLCIIESMKMMNEIKADRAGTCTAVRAANGQPVSSGDVLFLIA